MSRTGVEYEPCEMRASASDTDYERERVETIETVLVAPSGCTMLPVGDLLNGDSPRFSTEDEEHARALAATDEPLPPILVHRQTMRVIDGTHRVRAARMRGQETVAVRFFDGTDESAFVEAVRANIRHGKPLTLAERENAAQRILRSFPAWSDRMIADACALSPKTVGAIRRATGDLPQLNARIGRDGRARRLDTAPARMRAAELLATDSPASMRAIANAVGVSPGTVRDVRERVRRGANPFPRRRTQQAPTPSTLHTTNASGKKLLRELMEDSALGSTESGRALMCWLEGQVVDREDWEGFVGCVPLSRVYTVAEVARVLAKSWIEFAEQLEARSRQE